MLLGSKEISPRAHGALVQHNPFLTPCETGKHSPPGGELPLCWPEKKFSSLLCILRENKNLSVCFYEKISHFVPAGGEKREKKTHTFLHRVRVVCTHRLGPTLWVISPGFAYALLPTQLRKHRPLGKQHVLC